MHYVLISTGNPDNNSIGLKVSFVSTMLSPNYFQLESIMTSALDVRGNNKPMSRHLSVVWFFPDAW